MKGFKTLIERFKKDYFNFDIFFQASFIKKEFPDNRDDTKIVITCIGITSGVGRLIFGGIASLKWANRIVLQQVSTSHTFPLLENVDYYPLE